MESPWYRGLLVITSGIWVGPNSFVCFLCMITIYCKINGRTEAMKAYTLTQVSAPPSRMDISTKESAKPGIMYISVFLFTYSWSFISVLRRSISRNRPKSHAIYINCGIFAITRILELFSIQWSKVGKTSTRRWKLVVSFCFEHNNLH